MGIQKFCLQTQKFCLQIQKFCLRIQKFCLRIKKLCLRILKFCLQIQKLCLLLSWIWGGGTYAERCKTRLYWPVSIGVTAWQHPKSRCPPTASRSRLSAWRTGCSFVPLNPRRRSTTSPCSPLPWSPCRLTGRPTGFSGHASARTGQAHKAKPRRRSLHEIELPLSLLTVDVAKLSLRSRLANRDVSYIFRRRSRPRDSAQQQAKLLDSQAKL